MTDEGKEQGIEQRLHKGKSYSFVGTHKYNPLWAVFNEFRLKQCVNSKLLLNCACILCSETVHGYGLVYVPRGDYQVVSLFKTLLALRHGE